ncbi:MAG: lipoyl(octanoyl) transferase LipB [Planctomycetes bacterium]|nr:lipoyl(octanoyl) transferase LipB [Planctomycetota bacterium]
MNEQPMLTVRRLGRTRYEAAHALQEELLAARIDGRIGDQLLLTEHDPVVTLGRKSPPGDAGDSGLPLVAVERGGEATFHGPGQIVGYPILLLAEDRRDLHRYLRDLEEVVIRTLADFDVVGRRQAGLTGVWIGESKVCSLGVAVRRWVTWHGFALNVTTDLEAFQSFQPCGLDPRVMTRLADHVTGGVDTATVESRIVKHFAELFGYGSLTVG